ncbi:hypothetical protein GO003_010205 [Methylicorpusculum oleiharenae]|uniref:hypothetical protein n=1 Tax=Methylicorpusculum oleiharenae TaxID=1338687 RepID=UPI00135B4075|nr:hypothetical protein [Methylicorpusculum oleiharenae]MCD2450765.1 hypothetical protein [Methylicorpusculum oleiharenae]
MTKKIAYKVLLTVLVLLAVAFYDLTLPLIKIIIQLKINILGFFLEPFLQSTFDIELREARIIAAWIYLLIAIVISGYLFLVIHQALFAFFNTTRQSWLAKNRLQKISHFLLFILLSIAIGKTVMIFV